MAANVRSAAGEYMSTLGDALHDEATGLGVEILNEIAAGWNMGKVPEFMQNLKEKFAGEGFDFLGDGGSAQLELNAPDIRNTAETLQTAVGSFKVNADGQQRTLDRTLKIDERHLKTSEKILSAIQKTGGALT
jgi:hypothetical protein